VSAAWVGVQRILCHNKWGDANGELKHNHMADTALLLPNAVCSYRR